MAHMAAGIIIWGRATGLKAEAAEALAMDLMKVFLNIVTKKWTGNG